ncbi:hypothetical protein P3G55_00090 [Leptospira sp. 96542]|nr:hypothetical protein [Leptospira sp. 96542]
MKYFYRLCSLIILFVFAHCQSIGNYAKNRAVDFGDSFTIGLESDHYGAGVWLWCLGGGLQFNQDAKGFGMRNGHYGLYQAGGSGRMEIFGQKSSDAITNQMGNSFLVINSNQHRALYPDTRRSRDKSYDASNVLFLVSYTGKKQNGKGYCENPVNFEVSLGLYLGVRAGFNLSEFTDFILGFSTFDLMDDDVDSI